MERKIWQSCLITTVGLVLLISCSSTKKPATRVVLRPEPPPIEVPAHTPTLQSQGALASPVVTEPSTEEKIDALIVEARGLVDKGKTLARQGKIEEARPFFQLALRKLKESGLDFYLNPRLEQNYYILLNDIQEEEIQAILDPSQVLPPEFEEGGTPLDELSDLNLYSIAVDPHLAELVTEDLLNTKFDIPVVLNDSVLRFLNFYQGRGRRIMEEGLRRSGKYTAFFRSSFEKEGLPLDLIYLPHVESLFNPRARSRAKAVGMWQFVKGTGKLYGLRQDGWIDERYDWVRSTSAAARYLKSMQGAFNDWHLTLAAYNVGPGRIEKIRKKHGPLDYWTMVERNLLPKETTNYVPSILASLIIFRNPARYGFDCVPDPSLEFELVPIDSQIDLRVVAEQAEVTTKILQELNPELRYGITPGVPGYALKVPAGRGENLQARLAELPAKERLKFGHHRVRPGDTLIAIARKFSTTVEAIVRINNLRSAHRLSLNQELVIPSPGYRRAVAPVEETPAARNFRHVVRRGECPADIAKLYGLKIEDLLRWNSLRWGQKIYPGQKLRLQEAARH